LTGGKRQRGRYTQLFFPKKRTGRTSNFGRQGRSRKVRPSELGGYFEPHGDSELLTEILKGLRARGTPKGAKKSFEEAFKFFRRGRSLAHKKRYGKNILEG